MKINIKRKQFLIASAVVAAGVATAIIVGIVSSDGSVQESLSLGNSYLSDMDYESAIREYSNVLSVDPLNQDALIGLAKSYAGTGDTDMVEQIFENDLADNDTPEVMRAYAEIKVNNEEYAEALSVIQELVNQEDRDEDYEWMEEILSKVITVRHDYSVSETVTIAMKQGTVQTMGNNVLGALGNSMNLGSTEKVTTLADADFSEAPVSVYASGANSMVIDTQGKLWIAGSNRSGQKSDGVQMKVQSGWTKVEALDNVAKAAGTDSTIFALTQTGELWMIGENAGYLYGSGWQNDWKRVDAYGRIVDVQCQGSNVLIQTMDGDVYFNDCRYYDSAYAESLNWSCIASDISYISYNVNNLVCVDAQGIVRYYDYCSFPYNWEYYDENGYWVGYKIPYEVAGIAAVNSTLFILTQKNELYYLNDGQCTKIATSSDMESIYTVGEQCVVQLSDGSYVLYDELGNVK